MLYINKQLTQTIILFFILIVGLFSFAQKTYALDLYSPITLSPPKKTGVGRELFHSTFLADGEAFDVDNNLQIQEQLQHIHYNFTAQDFQNYHNLQNMYMFLSTMKSSPEVRKERQQSFNRASRALAKFLAKNPSVVASIESGAGYGVFEVSNLNLLLYAGGWGGGMVFDNVEHKVIYVDIFRAGTGLGLGYVDDYVLVVFHKHSAITQYFGAGGAGGDVGASTTVGIWSHAFSFNPTISTYHLYNFGADIQGNWGGTLYWSSPTLN